MLEVFLNKLAKLSADQNPLWGKMTPQHMVEHLIFTMQMSTGKLTFECVNPPEKIAVLKRFLLSEKPFPKLFINPVIGPDLIELRYKSLEEAIEKLKQEISYYHIYFQKNPESKPVHMIFGELNKKEWDVNHRKHFTHHLSQFGLI